MNGRTSLMATHLRLVVADEAGLQIRRGVDTVRGSFGLDERDAGAPVEAPQPGGAPAAAVAAQSRLFLAGGSRPDGDEAAREVAQAAGPPDAQSEQEAHQPGHRQGEAS